MELLISSPGFVLSWEGTRQWFITKESSVGKHSLGNRIGHNILLGIPPHWGFHYGTLPTSAKTGTMLQRSAVMQFSSIT